MEITTNMEDTHRGRRPQFSIIVPVFNTVRYIYRCIDSILKQDYTDFELILVDDGSSDGSGEVCEAYCSRDNRVRCIHQENAGVSSARNTGLAHARGTYIWFCDSDDTVMDGALSLIAACISETSPAMVVFAIEQVSEDGSKLGLIPAPTPSRSANQGPLQCDDLLYPCARVFKRSLAEGERFDTSLALLEDRDFMYRIAWKAAGSVEIVERVLYRYFITRSDSAVNSLDAEKYVAATRVQVDILRNEEELGHIMPAFQLFSSHAIGVLSLVVRSGTAQTDYDLVRGYLLQHRRYIPLLHGSLKYKYLLVVHLPGLFNMLTRLLGKIKGELDMGATVLMKET